MFSNACKLINGEYENSASTFPLWKRVGLVGGGGNGWIHLIS